MRYFSALGALMGLGGITSTATVNSACSMEMYKRANTSLVSAAGDWGSLLRHRNTFVSCDDGTLAEGYSDAVVTLLAHRWDQFDVFVALSERNPNFRRWAIRHIDATASTDDLKKIVRNAASCTDNTKAKGLCGAVRREARDALKDQATAGRT